MSFDYTTGDPDNLTGSTAANMLDIQGPFVDLKAFLNQRIAAIPTLVTNLPVGPVDGQEVYYLADSTNGVVWHLRYRSASGSAYKWEYVGGSPLVSEVDAAEATTTSATYQALTTAGPSITVPLAGDWIVEHGFTSAFTNTAIMSYNIGATAASDNDGGYAGGGVSNTASRARRKTGLAAATALVARYRPGTSLSATFQYRWMQVRPIRVG